MLRPTDPFVLSKTVHTAGNQAGPGGGHDAGGDWSPDAAGWEAVNDTRRGRRRRSRRKLRRGRRSAGKTVDISIFNNNLNGLSGKRASIGELLSLVKPTMHYNFSRNCHGRKEQNLS